MPLSVKSASGSDLTRAYAGFSRGRELGVSIKLAARLFTA